MIISKQIKFNADGQKRLLQNHIHRIHKYWKETSNSNKATGKLALTQTNGQQVVLCISVFVGSNNLWADHRLSILTFSI